MILGEILRNVPDYKAFLTIDELDESTKRLAEIYPDVVEIFEAGKSTNNHPIYCLKIGNGSKIALAYGCPHPNEPIGSMMLEYLSHALASNEEFRKETGYTWYIIKCIDTDGFKLNEGWLKGPFTIYNYIRNFYRPAANKQPEWTFPVEYGELNFKDTMPETRALMNVINMIKPDFIYSLHNSDFGGAYWLVTNDLHSDIYDNIRATAEKRSVPLRYGETEGPSMKVYSPAVFQLNGIEDEYDYFKKYTGSIPKKLFTYGTNCCSYSKKINKSFVMATELPYFSSSDAENTCESNITRREAILSACQYELEMVRFICISLGKYKPYLTTENPFKAAVEDRIEGSAESIEATMKWAEGDEFSRVAKVSEVFDNLYTKLCLNMRYIGMLVRTFEYELEKLDRPDDLKASNKLVITALKQGRDDAEAELKRLNDIIQNKVNYSVIPIQKLVQIQLESGAIVADYLRKEVSVL